jgi:hypothetical protein
MKRLVPAALLALGACASSAPNTLPAAIVYTGFAVGAAVARRAAGECYVPCTYGTVCNPKSGLCESAAPDVVCQEAPGGGTRCVPLQLGKQEPERPRSSPVGISPAIGTVPPPPAEASPRGP